MADNHQLRSKWLICRCLTQRKAMRAWRVMAVGADKFGWWRVNSGNFAWWRILAAKGASSYFSRER